MVAWYNHDRLHSAVGDLPPVEFEHHAAVAITQLLPSRGRPDGCRPSPSHVASRTGASIFPPAASRLLSTETGSRASHSVRSGRANSGLRDQGWPVADPTSRFRETPQAERRLPLQTQCPRNPASSDARVARWRRPAARRLAGAIGPATLFSPDCGDMPTTRPLAARTSAHAESAPGSDRLDTRC